MQSNYEAEENSEKVRVNESEKWEMQRQDRPDRDSDNDAVEEKSSIHLLCPVSVVLLTKDIRHCPYCA